MLRARNRGRSVPIREREHHHSDGPRAHALGESSQEGHVVPEWVVRGPQAKHAGGAPLERVGLGRLCERLDEGVDEHAQARTCAQPDCDLFHHATIPRGARQERIVVVRHGAA